MQEWRDFIAGVRGKHISLEETLLHPKMDNNFRLIDLQSDGNHYDPNSHQLHFTENGKVQTVDVNPNFHRYMEEHGDNVQYITRNGTPFLSVDERENSTQLADYYRALKAGEKQDLAVVNWRKTNFASADTGHAALSVGRLQLNELQETDSTQTTLAGQESDFVGSFYPTSSYWGNRSSREMRATSRGEKLVSEKPDAHTAGMIARNTAIPFAAAITVAGMGKSIGKRILGSKTDGAAGGLQKIAKSVAGAAGLSALTYSLGRIVDMGNINTGTILRKEEKTGHGAMGVLITSAQRDIMEHTLQGLHRTYYEHYQILQHNCADFTQEMLLAIGLNAQHMVDKAMTTEGKSNWIPSKIARGTTIPSHIRPDRFSWANKVRDDQWRVEKGEMELDGQDLHLHKFKISGQDTILVEAAEGELLNGKPLDVLSKALAKGVALEKSLSGGSTDFALRPDTVNITHKKTQESLSLS